MVLFIRYKFDIQSNIMYIVLIGYMHSFLTKRVLNDIDIVIIKDFHQFFFISYNNFTISKNNATIIYVTLFLYKVVLSLSKSLYQSQQCHIFSNIIKSQFFKCETSNDIGYCNYFLLFFVIFVIFFSISIHLRCLQGMIVKMFCIKVFLLTNQKQCAHLMTMGKNPTQRD